MQFRNITKTPVLLIGVCFGLILLVTLLSFLYSDQDETLPDFSQYENVQAKKQAFFEYLAPKVEAVNADILRDRKKVQTINEDYSGSLHWLTRARLVEIANRYGMQPNQETTDSALLKEALTRINIVPQSLALIQAAKESGWGTSKFARLANNLFGQQCFVEGCGIIPAARAAGRTHEVERFVTVQDAVAGYAYNLNSHPRYQELRRIRAELATTDAPITGIALAAGLLAYSERGAAYVTEIQAMIRQNNLE
ncbi:MAG: glucosaminidase domain-containing protein [Pseudomonadota bacterium]